MANWLTQKAAGRKRRAQLANRHASTREEVARWAQRASATACPGTSDATGVGPQRSQEERRGKKEHTKGKSFLLLLQLTPLNFIPPPGSPVSKNNLYKGKNCRGREPQKSCSWKIQKGGKGIEKKKTHSFWKRTVTSFSVEAYQQGCRSVAGTSTHGGWCRRLQQQSSQRGRGAVRPLPGRPAEARAGLGRSCPHVLQLSKWFLFRRPHILYVWYQKMLDISLKSKGALM